MSPLEKRGADSAPKTERLKIPRSLAFSFAVSTVLLCTVAKARGSDKSGRTVLQAHVNPVTMKIPVIDGKDLRFVRLSTADGLSQTKVSQIEQDDQGFLWFGTQYGLSRYDGYNFKVLVHDPTNPNSLSGVFIKALFKDRDGKLWIGCDQLLNKLEPSTETFTQYPIPSVTHISQDNAGMLWLATRGSGLYSLDPGTGRIRQYVHDPKDPSSLSSNEVLWSGEDRTGSFWVSSAKGLDEFDRGRGMVTLHIRSGEPSELSFYEDHLGIFWISDLSRDFLAVFDRKTNTLTHYSFDEREPPGAVMTGITAIVEDQDRNLWLATHGAGLLKFDRQRQRFIRYRNNLGDPDSLPQNSVENLFADQEGDMWAALGRMGVAHFSTKPLPFKRLPRDPRNPNVERFVGALYADRHGFLWVGTPDALNRIDRKAGRYTSYHRAAGPASRTDVISIGEDRSSNLWIGTYSHGLLRFDRRTGRFKSYRHDPANPDSLSNDIVSRLLVDHSGTLWVATGDGLNRFDPATEHFTAYKLDQRRRSQSYLDLVEDRQGTLWLGTDSSGLHRFDPATGRFTVYQHDVNRRDTLSDNRVNSVHFDRAGTMWVGTQDGLDKFDAKTGAFTIYMRPDGLPGNAVGCILEDDHGDLWMSTNNGVATFNPQTNSFKNYSTADGLPGPDLTGWGACSKSAAGEMFFGGFSGATAFFPEKVVDRAYVPRVILTDFRLFGISVVLKGGSLLKKPINYTDAITLSHNQNIFSVGFSASSYFNSATNRYRYMLEGLDRRWNEVGSDQRLASFTTLPSGIYTLRVQAATSGGAWSEPGTQLRIEILPPWWSTSWLKATYAALLLLIGLVAYSYRLHQMERTISARFDERLAERTRVARDLHDSFLQTIQGSKLVADDALEPSTDPIRMRRAVEQLSLWLERAMQEGRAALNSLRTATTQTNDLAEALRRVTEDGLIPSSMAVTFSVIGDAKEMHPIVRDEIYRIGYEAIRNACTHSGASRLEVELRYAHDLALRVNDNGTGIDPAIADRGKDGHFGLQGMRERAARIGSKLTLVSSSKLGTEIKLIVPGGIIFRKMPGRRSLFTRVRTLGR